VKQLILLLLAPLRIAWAIFRGCVYLTIVLVFALLGVTVKASIIDAVIDDVKKP